MKNKRWAVFISGRGSNLQSLLDCIEDVDIKLVVSNSPSAPGLLKAKRMGVATYVTNKKIDWDLLHQKLNEMKIERIFLAGFMRVVPENFVNLWQNKIINIHPSLLPNYPGLDSLSRAFLDKADLGVTIHIVTSGLDEGPKIKQIKYYSFNKADSVSFSWVQTIHSFCEQFLSRKVVSKWS